jgi:hypothetical protein
MSARNPTESQMGWVMACLMGAVAILAIGFALGALVNQDAVEPPAAPVASEPCCPEIRGPDATIYLENDQCQ